MATLFRDARVIDGSGEPPFRGDVLVDGNPLVDLALLQDASRPTVILKDGVLHKHTTRH